MERFTCLRNAGLHKVALASVANARASNPLQSPRLLDRPHVAARCGFKAKKPIEIVDGLRLCSDQDQAAALAP